jgi:glycopeptide antibiotics resistance protein
MKDLESEYQFGELNYKQSNRIVILAIVGILFLTLYPFRFSLRSNAPRHGSPFLLVSGMKTSGPFAALLNIALFVPFGFGLSQKLREKGKSGASIFGITVVAGALFSYGIEFTQIYVPTRDSGWEDVFTNTTGAVVGYLASELFGTSALRLLAACESHLDRLLDLNQALWSISFYFFLWILFSVPLQMESQLKNWSPDSRILVGNDSAGHRDGAWKGEIVQFQIWDHALPAVLAKRITAGEIGPETLSPFASYRFSRSSSIRDDNNFLPDLNWTPSSPDAAGHQPVVLTGGAWLASKTPVTSLVQALRRTKQYSLRVVVTPDELEGADGRIVTIAGEGGITDLSLRQKEAHLVFWFRNPLSVRRDQQLAWTIPDVFVLHQSRDILFTYDGSNLSLYIDGKKDPHFYELTPGTPLAQLARHVKPNELEGYTYIYYALVFFPGGALIGLGARHVASKGAWKVLYLVITALASCVCLEFLLVWVSGRPFSFGNVLLSIVLTIAGILWINSDRRAPHPALSV